MMTQELSIHPIAAIFPFMEADELERLADDIQAHGLREPVTLYEGKILDGRNRAEACRRRGIALKTQEFLARLRRRLPSSGRRTACDGT